MEKEGDTVPNRIIKESICTSEDIAGLSMGAEILFYHLMVKVDDFGVYYEPESKRMLNFRQENKRFGWNGEDIEYPGWVEECDIL